MRGDVERALNVLNQGGADSVERAIVFLQGTVFSFSMKLCGNRADAEDTMQETLFRVVPYLERFDRPEALTVWLYRTAKTRCLMSRRKRKDAPSSWVSVENQAMNQNDALSLATPSSQSPEAVAVRREAQEGLHRAVLRLPPAYRVVLVLRDMEGFSAAETGAVLGLEPGTVRVRLHRARTMLAMELKNPGSLEAADVPVSPRCKKLADQLSQYLDRELVNALVQELERHLEKCEHCRALLADLEETVSRCRRFELSPADHQRVAEPRATLLKEFERVLRRIRRAESSRHQ